MSSERVLSAQRRGPGPQVLRCVFFFQAEDGIRDLTVTGVQTCALPISLDALLGLATSSALPVVLDEFPYLARSTPELPSLLQRALSPRRPERRGSRCQIGRASCRERV